jgi:hypothetical protein
VTDGANEYDVFLSYARSDDTQGAITHLTDEIRKIFTQRTGHPPRVFFDQQDILTAQLWQERISSALRTSALLIAVISETYLASQWCRNEWDYFASEERGQSVEGAQPRIFPIYLRGEPNPASPAPVIQKWVRAIQSRQCVDLSGLDVESDIYLEKVSRLTDDLIRSLRQPATEGKDSDDADLDIEHHHMITGYVKGGTRFVRLLSRAVNVTIVGMTNENLATMLREALDRKRRVLNDPEAFWGSLRIIFLPDKLLDSLNDGLSEYPDHRYELAQRELAAGYGRRTIEGFLARSTSTKWQLFESRYFPPFAGALLEMPNGSRVVQLIVRRPQRRTPDHLYLEFEDQTDQYFAAAFEDIVHNSSAVNKVLPIGVPTSDGFLCTGARFFQNILVDGSGQTGWMPTVLVVTWWNRNGRAEPVLQLRTEANSTRELERLSHLAGYVYLDPYPGTINQAEVLPEEFELPPELANVAARNRIRMETGSAPPGELELITTRDYLHSDKEHLFFYIYSCELPGHFQFPLRAQMCHLSVDKLLRVRKNQTLRNAIELCRQDEGISMLAPPALEIVALNLAVHGLTEVAERLLRLARSPGADLTSELSELRQREKDTRERQRSGAVEVGLRGLSGLQYREFFTVLLPLYAELGIPGAAECIAELEDDENRKKALDRLSFLYHDEEVMTGIPVEL